MTKIRILEKNLKYGFSETYDGHALYNIQIEEPFTYKTVALYIPSKDKLSVFGNYQVDFLKGEMRVYETSNYKTRRLRNDNKRSVR